MKCALQGSRNSGRDVSGLTSEGERVLFSQWVKKLSAAESQDSR